MVWVFFLAANAREMSSSSKALYTISDEAYLKCVLHSAKYVGAVVGIFLGKFSASTDDNTELVDCLPLAHSAAAVFTSSTAEIALLLAKKLAKRRDLDIVGIYYGNEVCDDRSIGVVPTRLSDHIRSTSPNPSHSLLLMIDAPKLAPERRRSEHPFRVCARRDPHTATWGKALLPDDSLYVGRPLLEACDDLLSDGNPARYSICDFEDHCLDPKSNWLNPHVKPLNRPSSSSLGEEARDKNKR